MSNGVIYYNRGNSCLCRLAVSVKTLRDVYDGECTILAHIDSYDECKKIADKYNVDVVKTELPEEKKLTALSNKTLLHTVTPYDISIFLDSDTIVLRDFTYMFNLASKFDFVVTQFCEWTTKDKKIAGRIKQWKGVDNGRFSYFAERAIDYGPAINTGVYAFTRDSVGMRSWYGDLKKGLDYFIENGISTFIQDEKCCQIMLPTCLHYVTDCSYNESCVYGKLDQRSKILHFHGRKHCRIDDSGKYLHMSELWYSQFEEIRDFCEPWINADRQLRKYLPRHDRNKEKSC